ncbi:hypothetical protein [Azoarcus sp. DN11]|uniref:hypothetical protein n=1 Tax=Azoarcus sp. DN11 TaxID=356837 RepID=UPI000FE1AA0E|nr:hypothetical protein [Azoarcus sp. DN11]
MNPTYFQYQPHSYDARISGVGAVEMPRATQEEVFSGKPTSFTGGGTTLTLPLGNITRDAANLAFKDVFSGGVRVVESASGAKDFIAVIRPKVSRFTYEYNQLKNVGFAVTPTAVISLSVTLADAEGKPRWERTFESGNFEGESYMISGSPGEEISKATHKAMMKVMQEAADTIHSELRTNPPSPPKGEKAL